MSVVATVYNPHPLRMAECSGCRTSTSRPRYIVQIHDNSRVHVGEIRGGLARMRPDHGNSPCLYRLSIVWSHLLVPAKTWVAESSRLLIQTLLLQGSDFGAGCRFCFSCAPHTNA